MKIAITGTTSGVGRALKETLEKQHEVISLNRDVVDFNNYQNLKNISLANVDVLINNAGHANGGGIGFKYHDPDQWTNIINTNLIGPIFLTQKFINENAAGKIIFITSKAVEKMIGGDAVYTASKSGLSSFIDCLTDELKNTKFQLTEIRPGRIKTDFAKNRGIHSEEVIKTFYDSAKHMTVEEIIEVVNFVIGNTLVRKITIEK